MSEQEETRLVPRMYPAFEDANVLRQWDDSEQAHAYLALLEHRDKCIEASIRSIRSWDFENPDIPGLMEWVWDMDREQAEEFLRDLDAGKTYGS